MGSEKLIDAVNSVRAQSYANVLHLVVFDGQTKKTDDVSSRLIESGAPGRSKDTFIPLTLPWNTGAAAGGPFYGHRIFAGFSHLVNASYVLFLDEDNWYEPNHVETLVSALAQTEGRKIQFVHSLRKIHAEDGSFICEDNCESLGVFPTFHDPNVRLIDTSCFAFRREFLVQTGHLWHSGWGGDRRYLEAVIKSHGGPDIPLYATTGLSTVAYRLGNNPNSPKREFFEKGNAEMATRYPERFPWRAA